MEIFKVWYPLTVATIFIYTLLNSFITAQSNRIPFGARLYMSTNNAGNTNHEINKTFLYHRTDDQSIKLQKTNISSLYKINRTIANGDDGQQADQTNSRYKANNNTDSSTNNFKNRTRLYSANQALAWNRNLQSERKTKLNDAMEYNIFDHLDIYFTHKSPKTETKSLNMGRTPTLGEKVLFSTGNLKKHINNFTTPLKNSKTYDERKAASDISHIRNSYDKDTTFYFTHIGPHRFEYRAMFQHGKKELPTHNDFKPFSKFPHFPEITFPPFPPFVEFPELFKHEPQFPVLPHLPPFTPFTTPQPEIRRILHTPIEKTHYRPKIAFDEFGDPFKQYDVVLGDISTKYPKIFRFNEERINIEEFEKEKKLRLKLAHLNNNDISPPENVRRNQLLILHGGIFTVQEPPLYNRNGVRKRLPRPRDFYRISKHKSRQRNI